MQAPPAQDQANLQAPDLDNQQPIPGTPSQNQAYVPPATNSVNQGQILPQTPTQQTQSPAQGNQARTSQGAYNPDDESVQVINVVNPNPSQIDPTNLSTAFLYQDPMRNTRARELLAHLPGTDGSLVQPSQQAAHNSPTGLTIDVPRVAPKRPMDVASEWYLDYISPQSIKFYHRAIQQLPGEKFNGSMLYSCLQLITDRATTCAWTSMMTVKGRLLTQNYAEVTLKDVRAHAQTYQNEARRKVQNAEMLMQCLKASIAKPVYARVHQLSSRYTITVEPELFQVQDGLCYLKTIIDCYHVNTRSTTVEIRRKLAQLSTYMKQVAKGDVVKLCVHARDLLDKLQAAGEGTEDLLSNLMDAFRQVQNPHFQRWFDARVDLWSTMQINWDKDGSDLMNEAENYFLELKTKNMWSRKQGGSDLLANQIQEYDEDTDGEQENRDKRWKQQSGTKEITALAAQFRKFAKELNNNNKERKYAWKYNPPKAGESSSKNMMINGHKSTYYWCEYHKQWTKHKSSECKKLPIKREQRRKDDYKVKKKAYLEAKAALTEVGLDSDSEVKEENLIDLFDSDSESNTSQTTEYGSDGEDSNTS